MTRSMAAFLVTVLATVSSPASTSAPSAALTARTKLAQVIAAAKQWRPDAALTHVSSITVRADGTAQSWLYTFYAAQSKKSLIITATADATLDKLEAPNTSILPLGDVFIDSDKAMQEAKKHQLKGAQPSMGLVIMGKTGPGIWSVNGGFAEGDVSVMLNGKTGAFIRRQVISYK